MASPSVDLGSVASNIFKSVLSGGNVIDSAQQAAQAEGERVCTEGFYMRIQEKIVPIAIGATIVVAGLVYTGVAIGKKLRK